LFFGIFLVFVIFRFYSQQRQTLPVSPAISKLFCFNFFRRGFFAFFFQTFRSAATIVFFRALRTLNKKNVATDVGAVGVGVAGFAALVAVGNDLPVYTFASNSEIKFLNFLDLVISNLQDC